MLNWLKKIFGSGDEIDSSSDLILIQFRSAPIQLTADKVEKHAASAWENEFGPPDGDSFLSSGDDPGFVLDAYGNAVLLFSCAKGDRDIPHDIDRNQPDVQAMLDNYASDLSVSIAYAFDTDEARLIFLVASLMREFIDIDTIGVLAIRSGSIVLGSEMAAQTLTDNPARFVGSTNR